MHTSRSAIQAVAELDDHTLLLRHKHAHRDASLAPGTPDRNAISESAQVREVILREVLAYNASAPRSSDEERVIARKERAADW